MKYPPYHSLKNLAVAGSLMSSFWLPTFLFGLDPKLNSFCSRGTLSTLVSACSKSFRKISIIHPLWWCFLQESSSGRTQNCALLLRSEWTEPSSRRKMLSEIENGALEIRYVGSAENAIKTLPHGTKRPFKNLELKISSSHCTASIPESNDNLVS